MSLEAVAVRGCFNSPEILACHEAGITVTLPKPFTSGAKADGRFRQAGLRLSSGGTSQRCLLERYRPFFLPARFGSAMPGPRSNTDVCATGLDFSAFGFLFSRLLVW
jgi:hypothetical protein